MEGKPQGVVKCGMWGLLCGILLTAVGQSALAAPEAPTRLLPLKVVGTQVLDSKKERVHLRGVNAASMEWSSDGEGHILNTVKTAIQDWHVNIIRLPLAQDRWFGKAPEQKDDGKAYRDLVKQVVDLCADQGCYIMLDLHWSDANEWGKQIGQHVMPDANSVLFWKDCARVYRNNPAVLFDLYNEPHDVSWDVWLNGGEVTERDRRQGTSRTYTAVGMQAMLDAVRGTGAKNVVVAGGLDWSYDMSGFLNGKQLSDPRGNGVIYANHNYPFKGDTFEKWLAKMEAATRQIPVIVSEFGAGGGRQGGQNGEVWIRRVLQALHDHNWDWTAWDLHPAAGPTLISDWNYTPTPNFGVYVKQELDGALPPYTPPATDTTPPAPTGPAGARTGDKQMPIGIFANHQDVGTVLHPGSAEFDAAGNTYTVTGSGENMWSTTDAFHYVWKQASGDLALTADLAFPNPGKEPHRKACLVIRQSLDADSAYVDAALHGDGLTSLQFRAEKGAATHEVQANVTAPQRLRIEKRGPYVRLYVANAGEDPHFSGAATRITFHEPFYIGIGVCAHNKDVTEKAVFSNVELNATPAASTGQPTLYSALETQTIASTDRRVCYVASTHIEAPNWLPDGKTLIYNSQGRIHRIPAAGGQPETIDTGFATRCNNDHGISPDGSLLVISDQSQGDQGSRIYTLPITGGTPKLITSEGPSYWHGWSPDGKTLAYCARRNGEFGIFTIPVEGGQETRLTTAKGLDDGPEYSHDGRYIYFNSDRTGRMQIWRMRADGGEPEQITDDEYNNWFPHLSPDGRYMAFLSYEKDVTGHPPNQEVTLRLMTLGSKKIDVLAHLYGGQGTINVPCWSPDSRKIAFVTYQMIP
jgi:TolB protein